MGGVMGDIHNHTHNHTTQDIVETYLLREISSRSDQFLEAAAAVQDLRASLGRAFDAVKQLRQQVCLRGGCVGGRRRRGG